MRLSGLAPRAAFVASVLLIGGSALAAGDVAEHMQRRLHRLGSFAANERVSFLDQHQCRRQSPGRLE